MNVTLDHVEDVAPNIKTFWFKPDRRAHYVAGQFTELYLPHENHDDRGEKRWFTLSSSPTETLLSITTKFAVANGSTFKQGLRNLQPGASLSLADAMGDFVLPKDKKIPLLFVAGGMGITPVRSIIKYLVDTGETRNIQLLHGVTNDEQLIFRKLFDSAAIGFTPIVKEPSPEWHGKRGTIDASLVLEKATANENTMVYLSGPEGLTKALTDTLKASGLSKHRIITDFFPGYSQL